MNIINYLMLLFVLWLVVQCIPIICDCVDYVHSIQDLKREKERVRLELIEIEERRQKKIERLKNNRLTF